MTDGANPALDSASVLAYDEIEAEQIKEAQRSSASGGSIGTNSFDEDGNILYAGPEPKQGTFERFLGTMGNPAQWKR